MHAGMWRLQSTLSYTNAAGALFAISLPVAAMRAHTDPGARSRLCASVIGVALLASLSRGGILAGCAGMVALVALRGVSLRSMARPLAGIALGFGALVPAMAGMHGAIPIAIAGIVVAAVFAAGSSDRRAVAALLVAVALTAIVVPRTSVGGRVSLSSDDRGRVWSATIDQIRHHNVFLGTGPGTYLLTAPAPDGRLVATLHAHNEVLEIAWESGLLGLLALGFGAFALCPALAR